jgi:hypothetical protein
MLDRRAATQANCPVLFTDFKQNWIQSIKLSKNPPNQIFMKISSAV